MSAISISYAVLAEIIGEAAALALSKAWGGRALHVPSPERLQPRTTVVVLVGPVAAEALSRRWPGESLVIPLGVGRRARIWELREGGWTVPRIAEEMKCHERTIYNILAGPRPAALAAPPEAPMPPLLAYIARR